MCLRRVTFEIQVEREYGLTPVAPSQEAARKAHDERGN